MNSILDKLSEIFIFLFGSLAGTIGTIIYNIYGKKIQVMECHYIDDDVISRLPFIGVEGETHNNIYSKKFKLINTTNIILPKTWTKSLVKKSLNLTKQYDKTNPPQIYA